MFSKNVLFYFKAKIFLIFKNSKYLNIIFYSMHSFAFQLDTKMIAREYVLVACPAWNNHGWNKSTHGWTLTRFARHTDTQYISFKLYWGTTFCSSSADHLKFSRSFVSLKEHPSSERSSIIFNCFSVTHQFRAIYEYYYYYYKLNNYFYNELFSKQLKQLNFFGRIFIQMTDTLMYKNISVRSTTGVSSSGSRRHSTKNFQSIESSEMKDSFPGPENVRMQTGKQTWNSGKDHPSAFFCTASLFFAFILFKRKFSAHSSCPLLLKFWDSFLVWARLNRPSLLSRETGKQQQRHAHKRFLNPFLKCCEKNAYKMGLRQLFMYARQLEANLKAIAGKNFKL